jgi:serine protease AprX
MSKRQRLFQIFILLSFIAGLLAPPTLATDSAPARMSAALAELVAGDPGGTVRVIVQKAGVSDKAEQLVARWGGQVLKDLPMINAFAALLPARCVPKLARMAAVNWVSLDAPVVSTGKPSTTEIFTLLDTFSTSSFNNNDGLASWTTDWFENDVAGAGPAAGNVTVSGGELRLTDQGATGTQPSAAREADLSDGVVSAMLSYRFRLGSGVDLHQDQISLDVSTDGGLTYTTLNTFNYNGGTTGTAFRNILDYVSPQTRFRFRVSSGYDGADEYFTVDDFQIEYEGNALPHSTYLDTVNVRPVWDMGYTGTGVGVAVIDSGISTDRDFTSLQKLSFNPNSTNVNDVYGHGTHVAGILAGNGTDSNGYYVGIAPDVNLFGLKISDETGMAYESDTVEAMQWVYDNKEQHNIRVVNLSIQSTVEQSYHESALDAAAEILWFNGVVVVAASGNWPEGAFNPIYAAPANDPFIITVGATTEKGTTRVRDDAIASFSADGETQDFFLKPEIYAPGVDIISVLSKESDWDVEHPDRVVFSGQYFRISGTSMAAPMVAGAAALLLQAEPDLTPDQVKYRLMNAAGEVSNNPYLDVYQALTTPTTESANQGIIPHMLLAKMALIAYWASENGEENIDWASVDWEAVNWDAVDWDAVNWNAVNWNAVNWNAVNWNAVNWNAVNWNAVNWNAVNWNAVNWNAVNWNAVNWNAVNWNALYWGE